MADSDSSDVLANLPTGRPARRSSRRAAPAGQGSQPAAAAPAKTAPKPRTAAKPKVTAAKATPAAKPVAKATAAKAKPAVTKASAKPTAAKATPAKAKPAVAKTAAAKATAKPAARKPAAAKARATARAKAPTPATAGSVSQSQAKAETTTPQPTSRRQRMATPPEGRRADASAGGAMHRARKVTTNRPWLPASGYALPESKDRAALGMAVEGLAAAIGDVARVTIGIAQSLTLKKRSELETPGDGESVETEPGPVRS